MNWIALYTRARHECSVARQLKDMGYETYVPMRRELHQWSDRKRYVNVPMISSYVFLKIPLNLYYKAYDAHGVVRIVMFNGRIAIVREEEIELLRRAEKCSEVKVVASEKIETGKEVEIVDGKFTGYRGRIVSIGENCKVRIRIEELNYSLIVNVDREDVRILAHELISN